MDKSHICIKRQSCQKNNKYRINITLFESRFLCCKVTYKEWISAGDPFVRHSVFNGRKGVLIDWS